MEKTEIEMKHYTEYEELFLVPIPIPTDPLKAPRPVMEGMGGKWHMRPFTLDKFPVKIDYIFHTVSRIDVY